MNAAAPGQAVPVKFSIGGAAATFQDVVAAGHPQQVPVSCTAPDLSKTTGTPAVSAASGTGPRTDNFTYIWKTDLDATGCKELIVKLVDGSYHRALFNLAPDLKGSARNHIPTLQHSVWRDLR